jgi:putative copper resistance protein D
VAVLLAARSTGQFAPVPQGLEDPGAVVRWGLPVVRVLHDLAAALTIGLTLLGVGLVPGRTFGRRLHRVRKLAIASAAVWAVAGLLGVVLGFADIAGTPLSAPDYLAQFQAFVWSVEPLRIGLISAALAWVSVSVLVISTSRVGMTVAGVSAAIGLAELALAGHSSGALDHETAVNTLGFHILGAAVWVGGLLALAVIRPVLGKDLPLVVRRYSTVAGWCFLTVLLSGVVSAWIRLGSFAGLRTAYGAVLIAKVIAFVVLGVFGLVMRRRVVDALGAQPGSRALFARLVVGEVALMGVALGAAVALTRAAPPVPDVPLKDPGIVDAFTGFAAPPAPEALTWLTAWRWDWLWGTVAVVAIALYLGGVVRLWRRGDRWPVGRVVYWTLGWVFFIWASCGSPGIYGRVSFAWHMIEHMFMAMVAPILLVLGTPILLMIRVLHPRTDGTFGPREILLGFVHSRYMTFMANPIVASMLFFFSMVVFYYTPLFELSLRSHVGHIIMVIHFLASGYLFAWVLVGADPGPPKWPASYRLLMLFATIGFHAFFGVALTGSSTLLAPDFFGPLNIAWIPSALADQHQAGAIAWGVGEAPSLLLALLVTLSWMRSDEAEARRTDRQADRDGDAELAAYNASLARLAARDAQDADAEAAAAAAAREGKHVR